MSRWRAREVASRLEEWAKFNYRNFSFRRSRNPYGVFVACVMLQKTNAAKVDKVWPRFIERFPNFEALARADVSEVAEAMRELGLVGRARRLVAAARAVVENHGGELPRTFEELVALPGVGKYVAGAILVYAFGEKAVPVDVNVARVASRLGLSEVELREMAEGAADARLLNSALIDFGAAVCRARKPRCADCVLLDLCPTGSEVLEEGGERGAESGVKGSRKDSSGRDRYDPRQGKR